jgi:hypothetical protein
MDDSNTTDAADLDDDLVADGLIAKIRKFAEGLTSKERELLAALLAPGIDAAWNEPSEVQGFGLEWSPSALPHHLSNAIKGRQLRVEGW